MELLLLLPLLCCLANGSALAQVRHPLPVLWMTPPGSGSGRENLTAAVRLALQDLRRQPPPLGNYEIQLQLLDSQCDPAASLKALFDAMWEGPKYLLLLGGACPPVAALIARALPALGLAQVSFSATSPSLSNRKWHGNLFSTAPSDRALNQAAVKLLQRYKWTRVGVVTQEGPRFSEMKKDLMKQLLKADVRAVSAESPPDDACGSLRELKERDVRIIVAQFDDDSASEVFCCAHALNLFAARYQWILVGGSGWRVSGCPAGHLLTAADGSIGLRVRRLGNIDTPGVSGRTPEGYQDSYVRHMVQEGSGVGPLHSFAYDAVWVGAKVLTQVMEDVKHREKYRLQRNMTVSEEEVQRMLLEALRSTHFEGVTGPVFFRNGERMTSIELVQTQGGSDVLVGEFNTSTQQLRLTNHLLKFKGRGPAKDGPVVRLQQRRVGFALYVAVSSSAAVIIFISLLLLCLGVLGRQRRRTSQDGLLLLGVVLSCSSLLVSGLDGASVPDQMFEVLCSLHLWTFAVGHIAVFSALLVKTWRIYSLVGIKQKLQGRCVLLWMPLLDVLVLATWQILDPLRRVVVRHSLESDPADQDVVVQPYSEHCSSANMDLWLTVVYALKGPLLGLGCFLAWNIRCAQVDHPAVSSKLLAVSVFAVTGFTVAGASSALLTPADRPVQFCLSSVLILCCSVLVLSCTFGPMVFYWRRNGSEQQRLQSDDDPLSSLNQRLKSRSAQLDVEIETVAKQLSDTSEPETLHVTRTNGEVTSATSSSEGHVCAEDKPSSLDHINSPEHVRRRLSVQLPILHHSYLPIVGGVSSSSSSSSSLFCSQVMVTSPYCPAKGAELQPRCPMTL